LLPPLAEHLDVERLHVQAPAAVIFLCGGKTSSVSEAIPLSIRDAFLKINDNISLKGRQTILAEDVNIFYLSRSVYSDFLKFEVDLAQITELVVLFCESAGSLVEFGAFSMLPEISERLFVVMRSKHYNEDSFITLGPVLSLQNEYGDEVVYVFDDDDINIIGDSPAKINKEILNVRLSKPILARINQT
jgi:hypothetical protein